MSRTTHHRSYYKRTPEMAWDYGTEYIHYERDGYNCQCLVDIPGAKKKLKRRGFHPNHWASATPSWWVHDFMTVPKRAKCRNWEKDAVKHYDLEEIPDCPDYGRRPHLYYW